MGTTIIAIRHAKPLSEGFADNELRPISEEGKTVQEKMTAILRDEGWLPTCIWTSPLLRAKQTAEIVGRAFGLESNDEPALGDLFDGEALIQNIQKDETIVLVGHAPTLANFIDRLVGQSVLPNGLSKSGIAIVEFEGVIDWGKANFLYYYHP